MLGRPTLIVLLVVAMFSVSAVACGGDSDLELAPTPPRTSPPPLPLTPSPTPKNPPALVYDYKSLINGLGKTGSTVDELSSSVSRVGFSVGGHTVAVNGAAIQVYEFPDGLAADTEAGYVSPDGYNITVPLGGDRSMSVHSDWLAPPHYYKKGRVIVLYAGDDAALVEVLRSVLGPEFAGSKIVATK